MLLLDGQVHHDTHAIPMGNYVIEVGNYVIARPFRLGNYVIADTLSSRGRSRTAGPEGLGSATWSGGDREFC